VIQKTNPQFAISVMLLTIVLSMSVAIAQESLSALRGTVTDPSGAVIPGVAIRLAEPATGTMVRVSSSDKQGNFEIRDLKPGTYTLEAKIQGFKKFVADDIMLDAGHIRRLDVSLSVAQAGETVEVKAGQQLIDTEGGTLTAEFSNKEFLDAPLVQSYPNPFAMFQTLPGVQGYGWNVMINGFGTDQQHIEFDGNTSDRFGEQNNNVNFAAQATVTEMNPGASSARPVSYNLTSKRGSNAWHGAAHYQRFDSAFNAFQPPQNLEGTLTKTHYIQHDFQGEIGGPIWKNKTFFYFSWFGQRVPAHANESATVPTAAMMSGDFSALYPQIQLVDPLTGQPFPLVNGKHNVIPANRISSAAQVFQKFYPNPPRSFYAGNYTWQHPYTNGGILADYYKGDWPFLRIDHNVTSKNSLFLTADRRKTPYEWPGYTPALFSTHTGDVWNIALNDTHTFSPTVINHASFSLARQIWVDGLPTNGQNIRGENVIQAAGLQGLNPAGYNTIGMPSISFGGDSFGGATPTNLGLSAGGPTDNFADWEFKDDLSWQKDRHLFGFGGTYVRFWNAKDYNNTGARPDYGQFGFDGRYSGFSFADFLLGYPNYLERSNPLTNRELTNKSFGFYFTDTFKATPKLTLDYGLRWDYEGIPRYHDGLIYNFIPENDGLGEIVVPPRSIGLVNPNFAALTANPYLPGTPSTPIVAGNPLPSGDLGNFGPRVAAAYRLPHDMVIRGGYGLYWQRYTKKYNATQEGQSDGPFQSLSENYNAPSCPAAPAPCSPPFQWPNPFPATGASFAGGVGSQGLAAMPKHWTNGSIHSFNLTLEKEVAKTGLRASYIGSLSENQEYQNWSMNSVSARAIPYSTDRLPFPGLSYVGEFLTGGKAHYNALQIEAKRKEGWVTFDASYTYSSDISNFGDGKDGAFSNDPLHPFSMWAPAGGDTRNRVVLTSVWNLPFGRGHRFLSDSPGWLNQIVGGWTVESFSYLASGWLYSPWFWSNVGDYSNSNNYGGYPDVIPGVNPNLPASQRTYGRWFNTAVFSCADPSGCGLGSTNGTPYVYSHLGAFEIPGCPNSDPLCLNTQEPVVGRYGNASANTLHGDPLNVHHLSISKSFPVTERVHMTYTALISNLFNHPHYYNPDGTITDYTVSGPPGCVGRLAGFGCGAAEWGGEYNHAGFRSIAMKLRVEF
jgi:Carboxypeptidase regulatory-like domain